MADTTTTLNPGAGGDSMDESSVQQAGGTAAKRPRMVLGNDSGQLTDSEYIVRLLELTLLENRRQTTLLQLIATNGTVQSASLDELDAMRSD